MSEIHDCIELVLRLQQLRQAPPAPLRLHLHQLDGPREKHPQRGVSRHSAPHNAPQRHPSGIDHYSRGTKP